jgi:hypothetical protein
LEREVKKFLVFSLLFAAMIFSQVYAGNQGRVVHLENTANSTASDNSPLQLTGWAVLAGGANSISVVGYDSLAFSDDNYITIYWVSGDTAKIATPFGTSPSSVIFRTSAIFDSVRVVRADTAVSMSVYIWLDSDRR